MRAPRLGRIVLNEGAEGAAGEGPAAAAESLQRAMLAAIAAFTGSDGRLDYRALRASAEWGRVTARAGALRTVCAPALGGRAARLAFWINAYNAMVLHGIVDLEIRRSVREVRRFFARVSYRIGDLVLSADEVEHGILRDNARHGLLRRRPFGARDPRRALVIRPVDPRIHFAITCGARSCPPVGAYRAEAVDEQLEVAARNFLNQEVTLDAQGRVTCSRILRWYAEDFEAAGGLRAALLRRLDAGPVREAVRGRARPCDLYRTYDWALQHASTE